MFRTKIKQILQAPDLSKFSGKEVQVNGWVRTMRNQKSFAFIEVNDGSTLANLQMILDASHPDFTTLIEKLTTGASLKAQGQLVESPGKGQKLEMKVHNIEVIGLCDADKYPLQKKRHSFEYLRTIAHLRPRTNTQGAVLRVRNALAYATHKFFQEQGFIYLHTPILTNLDCEGAGDLFIVESSEKENFFGKPAYLTPSGQLNAEVAACALSDVYTFGPTFRAENSHTARHLAEFWMIEPEMAFADLSDAIASAEAYVKYVIGYVLKTCAEDIEFFDKFIHKGLLIQLQDLIENKFEEVSYTDAIRILEKSEQNFEFPVSWGMDLQTEHERYLTEVHFKKPVFVKDYPKELKAFYMRNNEDGKTVAALDLLVPQVGELIGGAQREERKDILEEKLRAADMKLEDYWWYVELREYGTVPHAGWGLGFERLIRLVTGVENIRDVIPFPRAPGQIEF